MYFGKVGMQVNAATHTINNYYTSLAVDAVYLNGSQTRKIMNIAVPSSAYISLDSFSGMLTLVATSTVTMRVCLTLATAASMTATFNNAEYSHTHLNFIKLV